MCRFKFGFAEQKTDVVAQLAKMTAKLRESKHVNRQVLGDMVSEASEKIEKAASIKAINEVMRPLNAEIYRLLKT
jgi:hypothetical protein